MPENLDETLLAFDYGTKKIGVAIGNTIIREARPLKIILNQSRCSRFTLIAYLLEEWQPQRLIVGLPLTLTGEEQAATLLCRRFARQLEGRFHLPVEQINEYASSLEAQQILNNHHADDAMAAAVILQRYFDTLAG